MYGKPRCKTHKSNREAAARMPILSPAKEFWCIYHLELPKQMIRYLFWVSHRHNSRRCNMSHSANNTYRMQRRLSYLRINPAYIHGTKDLSHRWRKTCSRPVILGCYEYRLSAFRMATLSWLTAWQMCRTYHTQPRRYTES